MKKMIILLGCVCCLILSCTHDEPNNSGTGTGQRVVEWEDSTLSGDAVMGMKMLFNVGDSLQVIRKPSTRLSTAFDGQSYTLSGDERITIALKRGDSSVEGPKIYKVKNALTGALEYVKDADDGNTGPFYWKSTTETVKLRAWSYGTSTDYTTDPVGNAFSLNTDQRETAGQDNYQELLYTPEFECKYTDHSGSASINLYHQMARLTVTLEHSRTSDDLNVTANSVVIGDGTLPITAKFSSSGIDIEHNDYVGTWTGYTYDTENNTGKVIARTDVANEKYSAVLFPGEIAAGKKLITLTTADGTFAYKLPATFTLDPGCQYNYTVNVKDLIPVSELTISDITGTFTYNGSPHEPKPATVKYGNKLLVENTDYTLSWSNNTNAGTATCTITGKGSVFTGSVDKTFTINRCPTTLTFAASSESVDYIWNQTKYNLTKSPNDATVEFTSSNPALVGVDASTGTLKGGTAFTSSGSATITVTATGNYIGSATYTVTTSKGNYATFSYNGSSSGADGSAQSITLPKATYRMECWGAQGGGPSSAMQTKYGGVRGGYGGYVAGDIENPTARTFYIYIGGHNLDYDEASSKTTFNGGWNGGGATTGGAGGGGGTDIRLETASSWDNEASLLSRIIVAGGGGGWDCGRGGEAGGLIGYTGYTNNSYPGDGQGLGSGGTGIGGNQNKGGTGSYAGSFGKGGGSTSHNGGPGGGGWYGGGKATYSTHGGGGGSSYISGHEGCVAVKNQSPVTASTAGTDNSVARSKHYSELYFTNTLMIDGGGYEWKTAKQSLYAMPNPSGGNYGSGVGRDGHGYARISFVSQ